MNQRAGFTLLEMLVVIGVLGIVLGLAVSGFGGNDRRALREAQTQLSQALERARTLVRRHNFDYRITIDNSARKWTLQPLDNAGTVVTTVSSVNGTYPAAISISMVTPASTTPIPSQLLYQAPFSRVAPGVAPTCFLLTYTGSSLKAQVDLVGATGKAVQRGITTTTSCQ
jgi:prepilin-type N-terminal cleavage/methylation domain-containing protein